MQPAFRRILFALLLGTGFAWIWLSRPETRPTPIQQALPLAGFAAPDFILDSLSGESFQLSDFIGQPVLLNFWASWCPPCRAEMPNFQTVFEEYEERAVILAINATSQDNLPDVISFITETNLGLPILLDVDGEVQRMYDISSLPTTILIDPTGTIQEVIVGGPISEAGLRARINSLLEGTP